MAQLLGTWEGPAPAYEALAERIRILIIDGRIAVHTWLPSERELAQAIGRSRTTVISAYRLLREQGYLISSRGAGSSAILPPATGSQSSVDPGAVIDLSRAALPMWPELPGILADVTASFNARNAGLGFDLLGHPSLRRRIADHYAEQGLPTSPSQVMVTLGAQHAIALSARALLTRGDRVLLESPTYPHAYEALHNAGGRPVTVSVNSAGWDLPGFAATVESFRPAVAYLMPDFHNPTGASMDLSTREEIVRLAGRAGTVLLIDETTRDLAIDRVERHRPLAALTDNDAAVVTIGSTGKSVWGGLRVGWIRADEQLIHRLATIRAAQDMGTPTIDQLVTAELFPRMGEVLEHRTKQLRSSRQLAGHLLAKHLPGWQVPLTPGGVAFWVGLGSPQSSALTLAARTKGVHLTAGPRFSVDGAFERNLRIPFTGHLDDLHTGVPLLEDAWRSLGDHQGLKNGITLDQVV
ncbi:PLP-dependent aminotransferase family protein [Kocuria sp. NPDC057446]|uniref:MocR-like transcription factor YczR n=1 Tax=Kocuria sp. NPDC057446 TaxID=3346137 RepID=UPI0036CB8772